jgi:phosphotriesterase-related protein
MKFKICLIPVLVTFLGCACIFAQGQDGAYIMTVNGKLEINEMGKTLIHEHIVTNFNGTENPNEPFVDQEIAIDLILPYLKNLKSLGYKTLFECTPSYIGKNVSLLKELSKRSGIQIVTNTGYYAAVNKKYLPKHVYTESAESLAERWFNEWQEGISDTGIRPGFIKLGVGKRALDSVEQKIVTAGIIVSKRTGMALAVHTGGGESINSQYLLAKKHNFDLNKLIWVHAQNGLDEERISMAEKDIWISLDGVSETKVEEYVAMIVKFKERSLLHKLLVSHDDGWSVEFAKGELSLKLFGNGNSQPYRTISEILEKRLYEIGFNKAQIELILIENPKRAMAIHD